MRNLWKAGDVLFKGGATIALGGLILENRLMSVAGLSLVILSYPFLIAGEKEWLLSTVSEVKTNKNGNEKENGNSVDY